MDIDTRYLQKREHYWHNSRRIPMMFQTFDPRKRVRVSLRIRSIMITKDRRNALERADDNYWSALMGINEDQNSTTRPFKALIEQRYKMEQRQAVTLQINTGATQFDQTMSAALGINTPLFEIIKAITPQTFQSVDAPPPARITDAHALYCNTIAFRDLVNKSPYQKKRWHSSHQTSLKSFLSVVNDKFVSDITREYALKFYGWWATRLSPRAGAKPLSPNGANRDLGAMRKFYCAYHSYFGQEDKLNPFRALSFRAPIVKNRRPSFGDDWIQDKFLGLGSLSFLRDIPLIGVGLEALSRFPNGFPSYRNKSERVSQYLLKKLRQHDCMPSHEHVIYSFRHSFERRMLEAGLDYGLRCRFMGHAIARPDYGGGGGMRFQREQLMKIAHPYSDDSFY